MNRNRFLLALVLATLMAVSTGTGLAADRMVGIVPSDGTNMLVKVFNVTAGTTILGAQFENNDPATVFPQVVLVRGPLSALSEGTVVASATSVQGTASGLVTVTWSSPVSVSQAGDYYIGICSPAGPGKTGMGSGPAVGADDVSAPNGSFVTCEAGRTLLPARVDLKISLLLNGAPGEANKSAFSDELPVTAERARTFLSITRIQQHRAMVTFGLEREGAVRLDLFDVRGKHVRELASRILPAGIHEHEWDLRDAQGAQVATGIYFVKLRAAGKLLTQKLPVVR